MIFDRGLFLYALLVVSLLAGCSNQQRPKDFNQLVRESGEASRKALDLVVSRSTAAQKTSDLSDEEKEGLRISNDRKPPLSRVGIESIKPDRQNQARELAARFSSDVAMVPKFTSCGSHSEPDPRSTNLLSVDYYTRQTSALAEVAGELSSIDAIFSFVRDDIRNTALFGATQSGDALLRSRAGSVIDKANLLAALLRAIGTPVQFESGEIYLRVESAKRLFDVRSITDVFWVLTDTYGNFFAGSTGDTSASGYYRIIDGNKYISIPHVWIRAFDGKQWKNFDPTKLMPPRLSNHAGLVSPSYSFDLGQWFFNADSNGDFVKGMSVVDFLIANAVQDNSIDYINGQSSYSLPTYSNGVLSDLPLCVLSTFSGTEGGQFELQAELVVKATVGGAEVLRIKQPLAKFSENRAYLSHSAGLLSELSPSTAGYVQFKIGDDVVGQFSAVTGTTFSILGTIYFPLSSSFGTFSKSFAEEHVAGGVFQANFFARPVVSSEIVDGISELNKAVSNGVGSKLITSHVHRLAGLLAQFKHGQTIKDLDRLRGSNVSSYSIFSTFTNSGRVVTASHAGKEFGFLPTQPGIDWTILDAPSSGGFEELGYEDYLKNHRSYRKELVAALSGAEAKIWEELFGIRAYSTERILQLAAHLQNTTPALGYTFLQGLEFSTVSNTHISSQLSGIMLDIFPSIEAKFSFAGSYFWSVNKEVTDPASGVKAIGCFIDGNVTQPVVASFAIADYGPSFVPQTLNRIKYETTQNQTKTTSSIIGGVPLSSTGTLDGQDGGFLGSGGGGGGSFPSPVVTANEGTTPSVNVPLPGSVPGVASCNPVDIATGKMWHHFLDINLIGRTASTGLRLERTYHTLKQFNASNSWVDLGDLGKGWVHNFDTRILDGGKNGDGELTMGPLVSGSNDVLWISEKGSPALFTYSGGVYTPPSGFVASLVASGSTYVLTLKGNVKYTFKKDIASNFNGRLLKVADSYGEELTVSYDGNGRLDTVTSPFAGTLKFHRDANHKVESVENTKNSLKVGFKFSAGKLVASSDVDSHKTTYQYNTSQPGTAADGLLTSFVDPLNRATIFEYYQNGKVFKEIGPGGATQVYNYAPYLFQKYTRVIAPSGESNEYRYDNNFRVIQEVLPNSARILRKWNSDGRIEWEKDALGFKTEFTYDSRGNTTGIKKPQYTGYSTIAYDSTFDLPTLLTPRIGSVTSTTIDGSTGDVTSIARGSFANGFTYNSFGQLLNTEGNLGSYSNLTDTNGFTSLRFHSRNPENLAYDGRGRVSERKFKSGRVLKYSYDNFDRVTFLDDTHGPDARNTYDVGGRLVKVERISPDGVHVATFEYDDRDRLTSETNFAGETTRYRFDMVGVGCRIQDKPVEIIDPAGKKTRFEYDSIGLKTREILNDGTSIQYFYNLRGDLTAVVDSNGNVDQFEFDGNYRLVRSLRQSAGVHKGNPPNVSQIPENTTYEYDEADRLIRMKQWLVEEQSVSGAYVTEYAYDGLDRMISKSIKHMRSAATVEVIDEIGYEYYPQLAPRLISKISNKYLVLEFSYEVQPPFDLLHYSEKPTAAGLAIGLVGHTYDIVPAPTGPMGLLNRDKLPIVANEYDPAGKVTKVSGRFNGTSSYSSIAYDGFSRRNSLGHGAIITANYEYDPADRLTALNWSGVWAMSETISRTVDGRIRQLDREFGTFNFSYNQRNEVASVAYSGSETLPSAYVNTSLTYDSAGNLATYSGRTFSSKKNFLTGAGTSAYYPDVNGLGHVNVIRGGATKEIDYFPDGKIRKALMGNSSSRVAEYFYDGLGRRIAKRVSVPSAADTYVSYSHLGAMDKILTARRKQGASIDETLYVDGPGIDDHLFQISSQFGWKAYMTDHLGSVINAAPAGGKPVYGLFGENLGTSPSSTILSEPVSYGFTGREFDVETGFYYFRARYYDPQSARFLTKDPLGPEAGGDVHPYRYVRNDPVNFVDPDGREPITATMVLGGAAVGGIAAGVTAYMSGADARTIAISAGIGAAAGAASLGASAFTSSAVGIVGSNVLIGMGANVAGQVATGTQFSQINTSSMLIGGVAGGLGAAAGLGAGTAAFYRTPVIGNSVSSNLARRNEFVTSLFVGTSVGTGFEGGANYCH